MLASKPAGTGISPGTEANPPYDLAAAATRMMWACAIGSARVTVATTARSLELWLLMLRAPAVWADRDIAAAPVAGSEVPPPSAAVAPAPADRFASYRSSGGHAAAQVVGPE